MLNHEKEFDSNLPPLDPVSQFIELIEIALEQTVEIKNLSNILSQVPVEDLKFTTCLMARLTNERENILNLLAQRVGMLSVKNNSLG